MIGKGIGNLEFGYYNSREDRKGNNLFIKNSEFQLLMGYERELAKNFTVSFQYYLEYMMDYGNYKQALISGAKAADENRHVITWRLTKLLLHQNLELSIFTYYLTSDNDAYLRPKIHYKINDHWSVEAGSNIFIGKDEYTFFDQFEKNTNIYMGIRYSFVMIR
jgi:hypothetical protein